MGQTAQHSELYTQHVDQPSSRWQIIRSVAVLRANGFCEACASYDRPLTTAHLTYASLGDEPPDDVGAICRPCHTRLDRGDEHTQRILRHTLAIRPAILGELEFAMHVSRLRLEERVDPAAAAAYAQRHSYLDEQLQRQRMGCQCHCRFGPRG